jgi:competence protein ComFC
MFFYESEAARSPHMSIIWWLKYKKSKRMADFVASELCSAVKQELDVLDIESTKEAVVVCGVPRGKRSRIKYGFDQSEMVAKSLSKMIDIPYERLLISKVGGKTQKELDKRSRLSNARAHIVMAKDVCVTGKYVLLFDDMVTTGASMSACVEQLRKGGAKGIACFSLACSSKM